MEPTDTVKKHGQPKKKLDLSTAKVADGALKAPKSLYEVMGISTNRYKIKDLASYEKAIARMDLIELQDEAYDKGVTPNSNRDIIIDRLVRRFIHENANVPEPVNAQSEASPDVRAETLRILARGR